MRAAPATIALLYGHRLDTGGVESHLLSLIRRGDRARFRWLVVSSASPSFAERAQALGAEVIPWEPVHALDALALIRLLRLLLARPADLIHIHSLRAAFFGRVAASWLGLPTVVTVHMPSFYRVDGRTLRHPFRQRLYGRVERLLHHGFPDRIIHVSSRAFEEALARGAAPAHRMIVIENGVDPEPYATPGPRSAVRGELATPAESVVVTCVARLDEQKGLDTLLEAVRLLRIEGGRLRLWLVGDGPQRTALEERAHGLGLQGCVQFLGARTDVPDLLRASDVFVLSSLYETTSFALLEAMAAGLPSVATDVGENRRLLGDGEGGPVVSRGDCVALAAALQSLLDDPALRERLGAGARRRATLYSDVRMVERTQEVYASLGVTDTPVC